MSYNVKISGIPTQVKLGKLITLFSNILSLRRSEFILRVLPAYGPEKNVLLGLATFAEAQLAQQKLDNFIYKQNDVTYSFTAVCQGGKRQINKEPVSHSKFQNQKFHRSNVPYQNQSERRPCHYPEDRSRSPHYKDATYDLDMQIEILRKQRIMLEEERKLLEEQRKLDQFKMKTSNTETSSDRTCHANFQMSGKSSNPSEKKSESKQLTFYKATGVLMRNMFMFVKRHSSPTERKALLTQIRSTLKQRLAAVVAADGQGIYQTHKVVMLYRMQHPPTRDEELVKEALKLVKEGRSIDHTKTVEMSDNGANDKKNSDGNEATEQYTLHKKKASAKDTNLPGDSNVSDDVNKKPTTKKNEEKRLFFHKSSGVLIKNLNVYMNKHSRPEKRKLLIEYLRLTLKERLAGVVAGKPIYQTQEILKLYRAKYPLTEDEDLIIKLVKDIDEGLVSEDTIMKSKKENIEAAPVAKKSAEDNTTPEDKIVTGEEGTDISGLPKNKETIVSTENTNIESGVDKIVESTGNVLENQNNEKDIVASNPQNGSEVKNVEVITNKIDINSQNDLIGNITGKEISGIADKNIKTDTATKATQECSNEDSNFDQDNRGVKRKIDASEDSSIKLSKIEVAVMRLTSQTHTQGRKLK